MSAFKLSQQVDANKVFLIQKSDLLSRWDATAYKSYFRFTSKKFPIEKLRKVAFINPKVTFSKLNDGDSISFIPMEVVDETNGVIREQRLKPVLETKGFTRFEENDLIWAKITPCMQNGKSSVVRNLNYGLGCGSTEFFVLRPKNTSLLLVDYLYILLRDERILEVAQNFFGGSAGQQRVSVDFLLNLDIPLPPVVLQQDIVAIYTDALKQKQQKEQQAATLLASIDEYLLGELGITLPEQDNRLEKRMFRVSSREVSGGRFDPSWNFNAHYRIEGGKFQNQLLSQIATVAKGVSITSADIEVGSYPVIAGGQSSPYSHNRYNQKAGVITVSASGAYAGFVWYHDYPIFASDCSVIRSKNESLVSTLFIAELLKLKQKEIYFLQQGAGQPHVYSRDLVMLKIPIPPNDTQEKILEHIQSIRTQAAQLQTEAAQVLADAKAQVERMILGEV